MGSVELPMIRRIFALLLFCAAFASLQARAERDAVQFFSNIDVPEGSTVHDAVCFFCSVNLEGKATGDVVVFFGSTHISSEANHDVVTFFGSVRAEDNATIGHDLVSMFGGVHLGDNVHVGDDLVSMFGAIHEGEGVTIDGDRTVQPAFFLYFPSLLMIGVIVLIVREVRRARRRAWLRAYGYWPHP
jgi:hypothetical protein